MLTNQSNKLLLNDSDFERYMYGREGPTRLLPPSAWIEEAIKEVEKPIVLRGAMLPWAGLSNFRLRPGEITIWSGYNETRKSFVTSQVALGCADQNEPVMIASFEMRPVDTLLRMIRQWTLKETPSRDDFFEFSDWAEGRIWIYNQMGQCNREKVLAVCRYASDILGVRHNIIDSLMRVVEKTDDYNGQKSTIDALIDTSLQFNVHTHIVAHNRKPSSGEKQSRYSIKGASEIADLAFNVVCVERPENEYGRKPDGEPDARLIVMKQRNYNWKGAIELDLAGQTGAFSEGNRDPLVGIKKLN